MLVDDNRVEVDVVARCGLRSEIGSNWFQQLSGQPKSNLVKPQHREKR